MPAFQPVTEFPDFGLTPEQRRLAVRSTYYEWPGMDGERGEIWCYSDRFSYRPGDIVSLKVSSTANAVQPGDRPRRREQRRRSSKSDGLTAGWQDTPDQCSVEGCGWETSFEFRIGTDWPSGAYRRHAHRRRQ